MELRLLGEPLLKSRASPLLSFLAPSVPRSWWTITAPRQAIGLSGSRPRYQHTSFHTTAHQSAESASSKADLDFLDTPSKSQPASKSSSSFSQRIDANQTVSSLFQQTLADLPKPSKKKPSSSDITKKAYENIASRERAPRISGAISQGMSLPPMPATSNPSPAVAAEVNQPSQVTVRAKRTIRSRPSIGRTVEVNQDRGGDFGRALRTLEILCNINRVRQDRNKQRFHERPGLKRKRLKSERWRKMFKESFKATVGRVQEMRRKGW